jgi:hypothetical protein
MYTAGGVASVHESSNCDETTHDTCNCGSIALLSQNAVKPSSYVLTTDHIELEINKSSIVVVDCHC